jgi:hypothetical protein
MRSAHDQWKGLSALSYSFKPSHAGILSRIRKLFFRLAQYLFFRRRQVERARSLRLEDSFPQAEKILSDILSKQPRNVFALAEYACIARDQGDWAEAGKRWDAVMRRLRGPAEWAYPLALQAAEAYAADNRAADARALIGSHAPPGRFNDAHLALADLEVDSDAWLGRVNDFLTAYRLSKVRFSPERAASRIHLSARPGQAAEHGPTVSVIMSAYNAAGYIEAAIHSILDQTWKDLELIVVDDCSVDSTAQVVSAMARRDSRIRLLRNPVNVGTYVCRNIAFDQATGEFVTVHDSDDWAHPERISRQAEDLLRHPARLANMCHSVRMAEDGRFELTSWGVYTHQCYMSLMVRREEAKSTLGYWDSVRIAADSEYIERIRAVRGPGAVGVLPEALIITLRRKEGLTTLLPMRGGDGQASSARRQYRQAYQRWHKAAKKDCRVPFPMSSRKFPAPAEIVVPYPSVLQALAQAGNGQDRPDRAE